MNRTLSKNHRGVSLVEVLLYTLIFVIIIPPLILFSLDSMRQGVVYDDESIIYAEGEFLLKRMFDSVSQAKSIDVANSVLDDVDGKISIVNQDDSVTVFERNSNDQSIEITEDGVTRLSSGEVKINELVFERIEDFHQNPNIVQSMSIKLVLEGVAGSTPEQSFFVSSLIEKSDFDEDGSLDYVDQFPEDPACTDDSDLDGICDEADNCLLTINEVQDDCDSDGIGDLCDADNDPELCVGGGGGGGSGCTSNCGDGGTGTLSGDFFDDSCYQIVSEEQEYPDWCFPWPTFVQNGLWSSIGSGDLGEHEIYWEKNFELTLTDAEVLTLSSILIGADLCYSSKTPFQCKSQNPMEGTLVGDQQVQLYNWDTESWESIGIIGLSEAQSIPQDFEVAYNGINPQRFASEDKEILARLEFHFTNPVSKPKASLMLIDYFSAHLDW